MMSWDRLGRRTVFAVVLTATTLCFASSASAYVYWSSPGTHTIGRANLDATGLKTHFIRTHDRPYGMAVYGQYIYWASYQSNAIGRASLNGTHVDPTFIRTHHPYGLAVDGHYIYWSSDAGNIGRADLRGANANPRFIRSDLPYGLAVDGQYIYWSTTTGGIGRANLDATGLDRKFISGHGGYGLAVNGSYVYWTNSGLRNPSHNAIRRANLDGTGVDRRFIMVGPSNHKGFHTGRHADPFGVAVSGRYIYWANEHPSYKKAGRRRLVSSIGRARLDGSGREQPFIVMPFSQNPMAVAVDSRGPRHTRNTRKHV